MSELVPVNVEGRLAYANALSQAQLLPATFKGRPADVLVAMDWGESLGLTPMQAMQSIHVVHGRPGLSSQAKQGLAVKAGHRIRVSGDDQTATARLWRTDDPEYPYESTWTIPMAKRAGLIKKDSAWESYPHVMLRRRAVADVVEQACPELLLGLATADLDVDWPDDPPPATTVTRIDGAQIDTTTGEIIDRASKAQLANIVAAAAAAGYQTPEQVHGLCVTVIGHQIATANDLTAAEADTILTHLAGLTPPEAPDA